MKPAALELLVHYYNHTVSYASYIDILGHDALSSTDIKFYETYLCDENFLQYNPDYIGNNKKYLLTDKGISFIHNIIEKHKDVSNNNIKYKYETFKLSQFALKDQLDKLGSDGWEICAFINHANLFICKRPIYDNNHV